MKAAGLIALALWPSLALAAMPVPARDAALVWLSQVDAGRYAQSWSQAGTLFRTAMASQDWSQRIGAVRLSMGGVASRTFISEEGTTSLPGAPDGDYDIITYRTAFANKKAALETVILSREGAVWRVDGYFVR